MVKLVYVADVLVTLANVFYWTNFTIYWHIYWHIFRYTFLFSLRLGFQNAYTWKQITATCNNNNMSNTLYRSALKTWTYIYFACVYYYKCFLNTNVWCSAVFLKIYCMAYTYYFEGCIRFIVTTKYKINATAWTCNY